MRKREPEEAARRRGVQGQGKLDLSRGRLVAAFALLLLAVSAVPVLAEPPPPENPQVTLPPTPEHYDPSMFPSGEDVTAGLEKAEEEEEEHRQWLASPEAEQQRQGSRLAYADLSVAESEALLQETFAELFANLNSDPARFLSDAQLVRPSPDETVATVRDEGNGLLMDSDIPVRTEDEDGNLRKVDLSLEASVEGFETANALSPVTIPDSAAEPIEVGEEGIGIALVGADGSRVPRLMGDENAFAPEVLPDTDMLVSPISTGVEIFNVLRSENSPESFRFQVEMPPGAELRREDAWGVEVHSDGEALATIPEPVAIDAQGTDVPVDLRIEGDSLVLAVEHREADYAMPILLDPILENNQNWIYGENHNALDMGVWAYYNNNGNAGIYGSTYCIYECFGPGGKGTRGLYVSLEGQRWYGAHQFGQWAFGPPNTHSYISSVTLGAPYSRADHVNCPTSQYPQPHDYFGVWSKHGFWVYLSVGSANFPGGTYTLPFAGDAAVFGLGTGGGIPWIPCWRDLYAGGAHIWLDDWNPPWIENGAAGIQGIPSGWVSNETPFTITAVAKDEGLGIKNVRVHQDGGPIVYDIPPQNECAGTRRNPCNTTHYASFDLHGGWFSPGERDMWMNANDPTGKGTGDLHWTMRVDNTPPEMTLEGQFAEATSEVGSAEVPAGKDDQLSLPVYNLEIKAKDGSWDHPHNKRSGVKDIEIYVDGVEQSVPWSPQPCSGPDYSCEMEKTYPVQLSKLTTSGKHILKVEAVDQVGKRLKREIEFEYFPATGMKDEYVMHYFPLPDGQGNEAEEEHPDRPELAVNVMNGNLVYRETDVDVESTASLDLEVERYYNSMLPENEETEWGDGWTLAQTPDLDPIKTDGSPVPDQAEFLDSASVIEGDVALPTAAGAEKFDPTLQATLTKKPSGGYELYDETGEAPGTIAFDATGQAEALLSEGYAKVDYSYEGGELAEIEVSDPATFAADPSELEIPEPQLITEPTEVSSFGSQGAADGQLQNPIDTAIDPQGNLWVLDYGNNRVEKFDPNGKFLAKFGSLGSGNGQFNQPDAIAVAPNGDILVADAANSRVQRFSSSGAFISKFGSTGTGNGQFQWPRGIAVDSAANVWVADLGNGRLQKFSPSGSFLQTVGSKGSAAGQFEFPCGVEIAPNGEVWASDWQTNRISVFSAAGIFLRSFGSTGSGEGQFKNPCEIEIDNGGNAWISDQGNKRIQQFDLAGQFKAEFGSFGRPDGIATNSQGDLWVADFESHLVEHWSVPVERPAYVSSFGSSGTGDGKLQAPGDVGVGIEGNLWILDKVNNRVQKFDASGEYLAKLGTLGSGDGQFNGPAAIAIDRDGNLLVADTDNDRIQKFSPEGQFISKFGSAGSGDGQFSGPAGVATDFHGNIWVSDTGNGRLQKFDEGGQFIEVVGSYGEESGQLGEPTGIDVDAAGNLWVADRQNDRVSVFDPQGAFLEDFGTSGTGNGQLQGPDEIEIDGWDNVWVGDQGNGRVQRFDLDGAYIGQFGSKGAGEGQFNLAHPMGIAADRQGHIWVTDVGNHRIQRWQLGNYTPFQAPELQLTDGDPKVEVETPGGLVSSMTGNATGEHTYEHDGDFLTSHEGPAGETTYEKDPTTGQLSKVTLPNGTWASIEYFADRRVKSVTVAPEGANPKTTNFHYEDGPPRRSIVTPPGKPQITYDIAADGSVFKWWHKDEPPEIIALNGSLGFDKAGQEVAAGDLVLEVEGDSPHGVASIQIIANGDTLVSEKICEQDPDPQIEYERVEDLWVTDTASLAPGVLSIEVIVTGENEKSTSKRWWVSIPHTPPPVPGSPVPPKFSEIQRFRDDYGLEVVFPVANEREQAERIFNLINAWYSPGTPAGEVARASWEEWGVPLRPEDVAELDYREQFYSANAVRIDQWVEQANPSSFGGYYLDHRAGGIMRIGFLGNQAEQLESLRSSRSLEGGERLQIYPVPPAASYVTVRGTTEGLLGAIESNPTLKALVVNVEDDEAGKATRVGTPNVAQVEGILDQMLGANAPVEVKYDSGGGTFLGGRYRNSGRMRAGDYINSAPYLMEGIPTGGPCTAGFGAKDLGYKPNGDEISRLFLLTAGHCAAKFDTEVWRAEYDGDGEFPFADAGKSEVGRVARNALRFDEYGGVRTDGAAIRIKQGGIVPRGIWGWGGHELPTEPAGRARKSDSVCYSGAISKTVACGRIVARSLNWHPDGALFGLAGYWVRFPEDKRPQHGDSGSPVWSRLTGASLGLVSAGRPEDLSETLVAPLLHPPNMPPNRVPGILHQQNLQPLQLKLGG